MAAPLICAGAPGSDSSSLSSAADNQKPPSTLAADSSVSSSRENNNNNRRGGLYKLLGLKGGSSSKATATATTTDADNNSTTVITTPPPLLHDVDFVLETTTSSPAQARDLLRGMVADLLRENDFLRSSLESTKEELLIATTHQQRHAVVPTTEYHAQLEALQKAVERAAGGSCGFALAPRSSTVLTPAEATEMTIQTLSNKVEQLHVDKSSLEQELSLSRERLEDLEAEKEACLYKIDALEAQFQTINKTRQHYVKKKKKQQQQQQARRPSTDSPSSGAILPKRAMVVSPTNSPRESPVSVLSIRATTHRNSNNALEAAPSPPLTQKQLVTAAPEVPNAIPSARATTTRTNPFEDDNDESPSSSPSKDDDCQNKNVVLDQSPFDSPLAKYNPQKLGSSFSSSSTPPPKKPSSSFIINPFFQKAGDDHCNIEIGPDMGEI